MTHVAANQLCRHPALTTTDVDSWVEKPPRPEWFEWALSVVNGMVATLDPWGQPHGEFRRITRLEHAVESSHWRVRKEFVSMMLEDVHGAETLVARWNDLFPAVIGQDVDLIHRQELMEMFNVVRLDEKIPLESKQSATLWMGLIFLTDPPEFMEWRSRIRDALFAAEHPPLDEAGDCWMRIADCMLSDEDPAEWARLTAGFVGSKDLLLRATRERVRGMGHGTAIADEAQHAEARGNASAALALWLDAGRLAAEHPSAPGAKELSAWWSETLLRWASAEEPGEIMKQWIEFRLNDAWFHQDSFPAITPETQERLGVYTLRLVSRSSASNPETRYQGIMMLGALWPLLSQEQQRTIGAAISPDLFDASLYLSEFKGSRTMGRFRLNYSRINLVHRIWPCLSDELRIAYSRCLRATWREARPTGHMLWLDAWSSEPGLGKEQWLLSVLVFSYGGRYPQFRPVADAQAPLVMQESWPRPLPAREVEVDASTIRKLSERIALVWSETKSKKDTDRQINALDALSQEMGEFDGESLPLWLIGDLAMLYRNFYRDLGDDLSVNQLSNSIALGFYASGVAKLSDEERKRLDSGDGNRIDAVLIQRALAASPDWGIKAYASPQQLRQQMKVAIEDSHEDALDSFLENLEWSPVGVETLRDIWDWLLGQAQHHPDPKIRLRCYAALFRLSPQVSAEKGRAMREQFRRFFASANVPTFEWPTGVLGAAYDGRTGRGEGIPWADDQLAAEWAWISAIKLEADIMPDSGARKRTGVFSYLAQAVSYAMDEGLAGMCIHRPAMGEPLPISLWNRAPLMQPFEPTPWQRARQLHLSQPELRFPDRLQYRPPGRW